MSEIIYRRFREEDTSEMLQLYRDCINTVCRNDYTAEQLAAWAFYTDEHIAPMTKRFAGMYTIVAEENGKILGYAGLMAKGEIDMVYTHKDAQGKGVATEIFRLLEEEAVRSGIRRIIIDGSITATPFYKKRGYTVYTTKFKVTRGQAFTNYMLEKHLG